MAAGRAFRRAAGFTYLGVLFLVMLLGLGLAGTFQSWSAASARAREKELLWVGEQYARALQAYYLQSPGARQYPQNLAELLDDKRFPTPRHHLRRLYADPVTRRPEWGLIKTADGRIVGVRSLSNETPWKQANFPPRWEKLADKARYSEWRFVAETGLPGDQKALQATATPATATPAARP